MSYLDEYKLVYLGDVAAKIDREIHAYQGRIDEGKISPEQEARVLHTINAFSRLKEKLMRMDE